MKTFLILFLLLFALKINAQSVFFRQDTTNNYYQLITFPNTVHNFIITNDDAANTILIATDTTQPASIIKAGEVLTLLYTYIQTSPPKLYYKSQISGQVIIFRLWGY